MDLSDYVEVVRRRWLLVLLTTGLTLLVVWLTLPSVAQNRSAVVGYEATATLIANPSTDEPFDLARAALFTTVGEVPERAAAQLGTDEEPQVLAARINATADPETGTLAITSSGARPGSVERTVTVFAEELLAYFERNETRTQRAQLRALDQQIAKYAKQLSRLDRAILDNPGDRTLVAKRVGLRSYYESVIASASALGQGSPKEAPMTVLQPAVALPQVTSGFAPPNSATSRFAVGGVLGLALALALAVMVERLDSRLRSRAQTEEAFQLSVLAEIPRQPRHRQIGSAVLSVEQPGSSTAEAFRGLRSALLLTRPDRSPQESLGLGMPGGRCVIMVTSARPSDGKTTTVANLAAVMAESGRSVLVLSMDFRHPRIHDYLDVPDGAGLSDLLQAGRPDNLPDVVRETRFPGVSIATAGHETDHPGALLSGAGPLISRARQLAEVVLIDTTPLLTVSDAIDVSPHVDAVLVVARAGRTTTMQAQAVQRLLQRLRVPALGTVLVGAGGANTYDGYGAAVPLHRQVAHYLRGGGRSASGVASSLALQLSTGEGAHRRV
jgi:Mrp family chromosome partitioning ATPase